MSYLSHSFKKSRKTYQNFTHHKFSRDEKKDIFALWYCIPFANMTAYLNQITLVAKDRRYFKGHKGFCIHNRFENYAMRDICGFTRNIVYFK